MGGRVPGIADTGGEAQGAYEAIWTFLKGNPTP